MTPDQKQIYQFISSQGGAATKRDIVENLDRYYANGEKHMGDRLTRMVKAGFLKREKPGVYSLGPGKKQRPAVIADGQTSLF